MTAEIAILNRYAVALAADSMATARGIDKAYSTSRKIFALETDPPVAVMVYGSNSLGPFPWDTIVQQYNAKRSGKKFATVQEYAADFVRHLDTMAQAISPNAQTRYTRAEILWELQEISRIAMRNYSLAMALEDSDKRLGVEYFLSQISDHLSERLTELEEIGTAKGLSHSKVRQALAEAIDGWELFGQPVNDWQHMLGLWLDSREEFAFIDSRELVAHLGAELEDAILRTLATADWSSESTGIVIAGVGDAQLLPALEHWLVDGVVANVVKSRRIEHTEIGDDCSAAILPFAQTDATNALIDGIHSELIQAALLNARRALDTTMDRIELHVEHVILQEPARVSLTDKIKSDMPIIYQHFVENMVTARNEYSEPFVDIVAGLPQDHLADMAEALVSVAAFKERFTPGAETVGGPIDVVLLSKGHGFVWANRK